MKEIPMKPRKKKKANYRDEVMAVHVRRLREAKKWTQAELAARYGPNGCEQGYISQLEKGTRGFGPDTMQNLAMAFEVSVPELWNMLGGVTSEDMEILGKKMAQLRIEGKGEVFERLLDILLEGADEAVAGLEWISNFLEKSRQKEEEVLPLPSKKAD